MLGNLVNVRIAKGIVIDAQIAQIEFSSIEADSSSVIFCINPPSLIVNVIRIFATVKQRIIVDS
ncbi:hypothetical protein SDC9_126164 [bioreactor metagenome]|uniref:Uncharacterized protein n=1 Tax=bioreactor metagenome TaxID=1076179 RepID=A0A645CQC3_9ZZZZ